MNEVRLIDMGSAAGADAPSHYPPGFHMLPTSWLWVDPDNMRKVAAGKDADGSLVASIRTLGILQPLVVTWLAGEGGNLDSYLVLAGRRRLAAAIDAGLTEVPCMVRETADLVDELTVELAENVVRADMSPIDVFNGVERLAAAGMEIPAIAVSLGVTERRVKQMRAMGSMHHSIVAHIRQTGSMPNQDEVRVICQAGTILQGQAFTAAQKEAGKGNPVRWWQVASGCRIQTIPMSYARFKPELYKGPMHQDLFATEETNEASSPGQFLKLQRAWLVDEMARWKGEGFHVGEAELDVGGSMVKPKDCEHEFTSPQAKLPPKKRRGEWRYVATVNAKGEVLERVYKLKPPKVEKQEAVAEGAVASAQPGAAPVVEQAPGKQTLVTQKGLEAVELAKRSAVGGSILLDNYATDMLAVALLILAEKCSDMRKEAIELLLDKDGKLDVTSENRDRPIMELAHKMLPHLLRRMGNQEVVRLALVDRIGAGYGTLPVWGLDRDGLDLLKGPGLEMARKAAGWPGFNTAKELKQYVIRTRGIGTPPQVILDQEMCPLLACDPRAPLGYPWPSQSAVAESAEDEGDELEPADEDTEDGDAAEGSGGSEAAAD